MGRAEACGCHHRECLICHSALIESPVESPQCDHLFDVIIPHNNGPAFGRCRKCHKVADSREYPISLGHSKLLQQKPLPVVWECFQDAAYYDLWCVRPVGEKRFGVGFHVSNGNEADLLKRTLNRCKAVVDFKTENGVDG